MVILKPNLDLLMIQILEPTPCLEVQSWIVTVQSRLSVSVSCCWKLSCVDVVAWSWDWSVVPSVWSCSCVDSLNKTCVPKILQGRHIRTILIFMENRPSKPNESIHRHQQQRHLMPFIDWLTRHSWILHALCILQLSSSSFLSNFQNYISIHPSNFKSESSTRIIE